MVYMDEDIMSGSGSGRLTHSRERTQGMTPRSSFLIVSIALFFLVVANLSEPNWLQAESPARVEIGTFSAAAPNGPWPDGWKPLTFPKIPQHTTYRLVKDGDRVAVKAASQIGRAH